MGTNDFSDEQLQQFRQQSATVDFDLEQFAEKCKRDTARLTMAAWGVGATHKWFRSLARNAQIDKVQQWVQQCLDDAAERRALTAIARRCY